MPVSLHDAISTFGERAKAKLSNPAASGQPEDQLRAPFEQLLRDMASISGVTTVESVGEASLSSLKTRPDYAVTAHGALVGFVELKAPGKGADPRRFSDKHDKEQWERLRLLPNLLYTDGNVFSLWQNGDLASSILTLDGDITTSGNKLRPAPGIAALFESFLRWQPIAPTSAKALAETTARLCRLLRDEVTEQLALKSPALTSLAEDWRKLLFPEANDKTFADGYAQAVTFGLLMARAKNISLSPGLGSVAQELAHSSSLIGTALRLLTDNEENRYSLKTALDTLVRVLDAVNWNKISKGDTDAWLYFYEDFLEVYDNKLRKLTGSYYTPPEVVSAMVSLVNEALVTRFGLHRGLASPAVTLADPATGTGTFFLGVLKQIADTVRADEGDGAVAGAVSDALKRLIAFEMQLGPFAVAQLRILAEVVSLTGHAPRTAPRMFVTNTLSDPEEKSDWFPQMLAPLANQRKDANQILRNEAITVVLGNPPYKERAKGRGSWIEQRSTKLVPAPLEAWMPPPEWGEGVHSRHLRNLYIYFWRWATWKVFDHGDGKPGPHNGIVCFITVAGFLSGPGFQKMRSYLRETCDDIWVIDCSPEGHQPGVNTRIFQSVQQPICIVLALRSTSKGALGPAHVRFRTLPLGCRKQKFSAMAGISLLDDGWTDCPIGTRAPFFPQSTGHWARFPTLEDLFLYHGSGVQPKRTWVIAPDPESLSLRWRRLMDAPLEDKEQLFHATLRGDAPADRHIRSVIVQGIPGFPGGLAKIIEEAGDVLQPVRYGFRSFNRQWVIPDARVVTQPNAELWASRSHRQVYLTALSRTSPRIGPALSFTGLIPDLDHYNGRGGRAFPLWSNQEATEPNLKPALLRFLSDTVHATVTPEDAMAYIAAVAANPAYTIRFLPDMSTPGLRIPITADAALFQQAVTIGRRVLWLHTFGERMADAAYGRPPQPPRLPPDRRPTIPKNGAISESPDDMPDVLDHDAGKHRLLIGHGFIDNVTPAMWAYEVSGKKVVKQWFSYRKRHRDHPIIGDRRPPSKLGDIQPDHWLPEYTTELLNVLNILGLLIDLEPEQKSILEAICAGPLLSESQLQAAGALQAPPKPPTMKKTKKQKAGPSLFGANAG